MTKLEKYTSTFKSYELQYGRFSYSKNGHTPTYMAVLDHFGEMVSAVVDMKIIDEFTTEFIDSKAEIIKNAEYMVLDSDRPDIVEHILKTFSNDTKFILDPVSAAKAKTVTHLVKYFHTIKPNRYEAEIMCGFKINNEEDLRKAGKYFTDLGVKMYLSLLMKTEFTTTTELKKGN